LPAIPGTAPEVRVDPLAPFATRLVLADLRLASGDLARAGSDFAALAAERPNSADVHAALGALALRRGDSAGAVTSWKRAIQLGIADADLCFRYAALADDRGLPALDTLRRAIELRPDFDDARFKLALLEKNSGHAEAALAQLRAMRRVAPFRAFAYWIAVADCNLDLDRRNEARQAALQAREHAAGDEERRRAEDFVWVADSELAVEIAGPNQFRTIRVPVKGPPRNPFIEAGDRARQAEGTLREVQCPEGGGIQLLVDSPKGALALSALDLSRVQIRNGGGEKFEFICGPQDPRKVLVEYDAEKSLLRGIEFR
jgi:tetratricopeptide (TPR) repeat protein